MMKKIWHKFLLLAVLGFIPVFSQAQVVGCLPISSGKDVVQQPKTTPIPGGWKVTAQFLLSISAPDCFIMPVAISPLTTPFDQPESVTVNGVSVNIRQTKLWVRNSPNCQIINNGQQDIELRCNSLPQSVLIEVENTLIGKSTTTTAKRLFGIQLAILLPGPLTSANWSTQNLEVIVPLSTAPTCNFLIDQPNITLGTISFSDIANLTAGTAVASGQKNINITVNCATGALSANTTFAPQFSPTKSAILSGDSHVALIDGTDNGVGFKLFDSSGNALVFKTALTSTNTQFAFTPTLQTVTKSFSFKYAKTSQAVKVGPVTSTIMVTFSIL